MLSDIAWRSAVLFLVVVEARGDLRIRIAGWQAGIRFPILFRLVGGSCLARFEYCSHFREERVGARDKRLIIALAVEEDQGLYLAEELAQRVLGRLACRFDGAYQTGVLLGEPTLLRGLVGGDPFLQFREPFVHVSQLQLFLAQVVEILRQVVQAAIFLLIGELGYVAKSSISKARL